MKRMTILTGFGLTILYGLLQVLFADTTQVTLRECLISEKEAVLTLENTGSQDLAKICVAVKVFEAGCLVTSSNLVEKRNLSGKGKTRVRLTLNKSLTRGADYRIVAWVQTGTAQPISQEFSGKILKQTASVWVPGRPFIAIPEPVELRNTIQTFDVRLAMGLL